MRKRLLSFILFALLLAAMLTLFVGAETEDAVTSGLFFDYTEESAFVTLIVIISVIGIAIPILPIVYSLLKLFREKCAYPMPYYVMFIASAVWCVAGIVLLIIFLV